jgi:hypothetical protein
MAKTKAKPRKPAKVASSPQAPSGVWTPQVLLEALKGGTVEDKVAALRAAGILDAKGQLTKKYKTWGTKVSRTPEADATALKA